MRSLTCIDRDIHRSAYISRLYFENQLCSAPITSPHGHTDIGIRVTLGDLGAYLFPKVQMSLVQTLGPTDCQDASDILIYGRLLEKDHSSPSSSKSQHTPSMLQLRAARILTAPPIKQTRPPRPDDPVPRFPPTLMCTKKRRAEESPSTRLKRRKEEAVLQNARDVMRRIPSADVIGNLNIPELLSQAQTTQDDVFKVPPLPDLKGKGKALDIAKELEKANKAVSHARYLSFSHLPSPGYT